MLTVKNIGLFSLIISLLIATGAQADNHALKDIPSGTYTMDKSHASLIWRVNHLGLSNYTARFKSFDSTITLDSADPSKSSVTATINPASVETDYVATDEKDFNKKLSEDEAWFNSKKFPEIKFVSTKIDITGEKTANIHGDLTFLGVTKPVVLATTFIGGMAEHPYSKTAAIGFSAKTTITRSEWGFSAYIPNIGDAVEVQIDAEFMQSK